MKKFLILYGVLGFSLLGIANYGHCSGVQKQEKSSIRAALARFWHIIMWGDQEPAAMEISPEQQWNSTKRYFVNVLDELAGNKDFDFDTGKFRLRGISRIVPFAISIPLGALAWGIFLNGLCEKYKNDSGGYSKEKVISVILISGFFGFLVGTLSWVGVSSLLRNGNVDGIVDMLFKNFEIMFADMDHMQAIMPKECLLLLKKFEVAYRTQGKEAFKKNILSAVQEIRQVIYKRFKNEYGNRILVQNYNI